MSAPEAFNGTIEHMNGSSYTGSIRRPTDAEKNKYGLHDFPCWVVESTGLVAVPLDKVATINPA